MKTSLSTKTRKGRSRSLVGSRRNPSSSSTRIKKRSDVNGNVTDGSRRTEGVKRQQRLCSMIEITPLYQPPTFPISQTEEEKPSSASSLSSPSTRFTLPTTLGRYNLGQCWWKHCPNRCQAHQKFALSRHARHGGAGLGLLLRTDCCDSCYRIRGIFQESGSTALSAKMIELEDGHATTNSNNNVGNVRIVARHPGTIQILDRMGVSVIPNSSSTSTANSQCSDTSSSSGSSSSSSSSLLPQDRTQQTTNKIGGQECPASTSTSSSVVYYLNVRDRRKPKGHFHWMHFKLRWIVKEMSQQQQEEERDHAFGDSILVTPTTAQTRTPRTRPTSTSILAAADPTRASRYKNCPDNDDEEFNLVDHGGKNLRYEEHKSGMLPSLSLPPPSSSSSSSSPSFLPPQPFRAAAAAATTHASASYKDLEENHDQQQHLQRGLPKEDYCKSQTDQGSNHHSNNNNGDNNGNDSVSTTSNHHLNERGSFVSCSRSIAAAALLEILHQNNNYNDDGDYDSNNNNMAPADKYNHNDINSNHADNDNFGIHQSQSVPQPKLVTPGHPPHSYLPPGGDAAADPLETTEIAMTQPEFAIIQQVQLSESSKQKDLSSLWNPHFEQMSSQQGEDEQQQQQQQQHLTSCRNTRDSSPLPSSSTPSSSECNIIINNNNNINHKRHCSLDMQEASPVRKRLKFDPVLPPQTQPLSLSLLPSSSHEESKSSSSLSPELSLPMHHDRDYHHHDSPSIAETAAGAPETQCSEWTMQEATQPIGPRKQNGLASRSSRTDAAPPLPPELSPARQCRHLKTLAEWTKVQEVAAPNSFRRNVMDLIVHVNQQRQNEMTKDKSRLQGDYNEVATTPTTLWLPPFLVEDCIIHKSESLNPT